MLLVGPDKVSIRASSKVLRLASRVFDKMLGPHFAEGQSLSGEGSLEKSAASPTEFTLPDDDSEAMVLFCDTIHFKRHATPDIAFPLLAKMAFLSDKYDSSLALSSESEIWLSNFRGSKEGESCFGKMLWISYAMGNHRTFSKISREMIRECSHDELARQKHEMDCTSLPETIIGKFTSSISVAWCPDTQLILTRRVCRRDTRFGLLQSVRRYCFSPKSTYEKQMPCNRQAPKLWISMLLACEKWLFR